MCLNAVNIILVLWYSFFHLYVFTLHSAVQERDCCINNDVRVPYFISVCVGIFLILVVRIFLSAVQ